VSATNGSDSNDGLSRSTPYATLAKALSVSHGAADLDILVSEGTYPEGVPLQSYIRILGGYASDFAARDPGPRVAPAQHETIFTGTVAIRGDSNSLTGMYAPISAKAVVVDGVTIRPNGSTPNIYGAYMDNSWTACCGGVQGNGSEVTLRNDRISSGVPSASSATARAIYFGCDATQVLDGSVVTSFGTDAYNDVGVFGGCIGYVGSTLTLTNNLIRATIGVIYDAPYNVGFAPTNALIMFGNRIEGRDEPGAPLGATTSGLRTSGSGPKLDVHDNVFVPNRASYLAGENSEGFHPSGSSWGTFANNVIDGGHNADNSYGVFLEGTPPAGTTFAVVNNLVSAGVGAHRREGLHTYNVSGHVVFAHNTVIAVADGLTLPINYGLTFVEASGGRVLNNFFFGQYGIPSQLLAGTLDSFQNNLIFAPSSLTLINGVPPGSDVPTFEAYACSHGVAASGTAVVTSLNGLFAPNADADGDWTTVTDSAWVPLASAQSTFAIGLDTTVAQCGSGACNGTGASWCGGAMTTDLTGKTRTAPPVVGAYQP